MTIYGPSSENYDEAIDPILMTDWMHISAFEAWTDGKKMFADSILLNGTGQYTPSDPKTCVKGDTPPKYSISFQKVGPNHVASYLKMH